MFYFWASAISHIGYTTWESSRMYQEEKAPILKRSHGTALSVVPNVENHAFYIFGRITSSHDAITLENHVCLALGSPIRVLVCFVNGPKKTRPIV